MAKKPRDESEPVVIRKYANRRLYNTETSCYVTLDHLSEMVKEGRDFVVRDAKSGDDITHSVLTQIIIEEESKGGETLLPIPFLRQLIQYYGDNMQTMVPGYLQSAMDAFAKNQSTLKDYMENQWQGAPGGNIMEEMARRNMAMFQDALSMFNPLNSTGQGSGANAGAAGSASSPAEASKEAPEGDDLTAMKAQLAAMQAQLEKMSKD